MWNQVKEHSVVFLTVSVILGGFLYSIITSYDNNTKLTYLNNELKKFRETNEKYQNNTKITIKKIISKLVNVLDKKDIQDLLLSSSVDSILDKKEIQDLLYLNSDYLTTNSKTNFFNNNNIEIPYFDKKIILKELHKQIKNINTEELLKLKCLQNKNVDILSTFIKLYGREKMNLYSPSLLAQHDNNKIDFINIEDNETPILYRKFFLEKLYKELIKNNITEEQLLPCMKDMCNNDDAVLSFYGRENVYNYAPSLLTQNDSNVIISIHDFFTLDTNNTSFIHTGNDQPYTNNKDSK